MKNVLFYFRVLLENLFIWAGGVALFVIIGGLLEPICEDKFGRRSSTWFYTVLVLLLAAAAIRIQAAHRKALGEQIKTFVFVILNLVPMLFLCWFILSLISSFS